MSRGFLKKDSSSEWASEIRSLRIARKLSQDNLAAKLHVASSSVSFWETGKVTPPHLSAEWIRLILSLSPDIEEAVEKRAKEQKKTIAQVCADLVTFAVQYDRGLPLTRPFTPQELEDQAQKHKKLVEAQKDVRARRRTKSA